MTASKAEEIRHQVAELDDRGLPVAEIARSIGITHDRVEQILDQLDGVAHDIEPAPAIEPMNGKVVHAGTVTPLPARTTQPGPEPTKSSPLPVKASPEPVKPAQRPAAEVVDPEKNATAMPAARSEVATAATMPGRTVAAPQRTRPAAEVVEAAFQSVAEAIASGEVASAASPRRPLSIKHGTVQGYKRHYRTRDFPACDACKDAYNTAQREKTAERNASKPIPTPVNPPRRRRPAECGTYAGYMRHMNTHSQPCDPCRQARRDYENERRAKKRAATSSVEPSQLPATVVADCTPSYVPAAGEPPTSEQVSPERTKVQIRWLIPRGEQLPHDQRVEYGLVVNDRIVPCSPETAEASANYGARVLRRLVTNWEVISE